MLSVSKIVYDPCGSTALVHFHGQNRGSSVIILIILPRSNADMLFYHCTNLTITKTTVSNRYYHSFIVNIRYIMIINSKTLQFNLHQLIFLNMNWFACVQLHQDCISDRGNDYCFKLYFLK